MHWCIECVLSPAACCTRPSTQQRKHGSHLQLPCGDLHILHHLHHHHRLLHDEHFCGFCHCHVSGAGRERVHELWAGQEPGLQVHTDVILIQLGYEWKMRVWVFLCFDSASVWSMLWKPVRWGDTSLKTRTSISSGMWWTLQALSMSCLCSSSSTHCVWPFRWVDQYKHQHCYTYTVKKTHFDFSVCVNPHAVFRV